MEKINIDMYIRTKDGKIDKILELNKSYVKGVSQKDELYAYDIDNIVKASYNITDLIEVGDIITFKNDKDIYRVNCIPNKENGCECFYLEFDYADKYGVEDIRVFIEEMENDLESIVTKEQFSSMEYKVRR